MELTDRMKLQEIAREKVMEWYEIGLQKFPQERRHVEIAFNLGGTTAGKAWWRKTGCFTIQINQGLLEENPQGFWDDTIPHEVAHLIANEFFKEIALDGCGHGDLWKFVMIKFGKKPTRCHDYSVESVRGKRSQDIVEVL